MSFIGQAAKTFGGLAELTFQVVLFGRGALYIEGAKPIRIDKCEMIFGVRGSVITVTGDGLAVKELADDCTYIVGRIDGFAVKDL